MPRLYLSVAALILAFSAGWAVQGWRMGEQAEALRADAEAQARSAAERVRGIEQLRQRERDAAAVEYASAVAEQELKTRIITREVIRYVQSSPADCALDADWVRIYNASLGLSGGESAAGGAAAAASAHGAAESDQY